MDDDWDLHAVVRSGYAAAARAARTAPPAADHHARPLPQIHPLHQSHHFPPATLIDPNIRSDYPLHSTSFYLDNQFRGADPVGASPIPPPAALSFQKFHHQEILQMQPPMPMTIPMNMNIIPGPENMQLRNPRIGIPSQNFQVANNPLPIRQHKRKNQQAKLVRRIKQEELAADSWAWRKYGQKPIKGSPYPSTSKGCAARRQVERSPDEPGIYVVSYTGEHTHPRPAHRSSLAGSSRGKFSPTAAAAAKTKMDNNAASEQKASFSSSSTGSHSSASPTTEGGAAAQNDDIEMAEEDAVGGDDIDKISIPVPSDDGKDVFGKFRDHSDRSIGAGELLSNVVLSSPP